MRHPDSPPNPLSAAAVALALVVAALAAPAAAVPQDQLKFGVDMARRGLWSEALFRFERALRENPGNSRIVNNLAVANEAVGNFDRALELYREAVQLDPGNAELKRNYARFVEFYQSFRPREEESAAEEAPAASADQPESPTAEESR